MSTLTSAPPMDGAQGGWSQQGEGARVRRRRRSVPHLLLGVVLVLLCAIGFVLFTVVSGGRHAVLALARPVTVGHVLAVADLRSVDVGVDDGVVEVIDADQAGSVLGQPVATSLPAGVLLSPPMVGVPLAPDAGQAVVAVAVKPGQIPAEAAAGSSVLVVEQPSTASLPGSTTPVEPRDSGEPWSAVVVSVVAATDGQTTVVSLRMSDDAARQVAAVTPGQLAIVLITGGR